MRTRKIHAKWFSCSRVNFTLTDRKCYRNDLYKNGQFPQADLNEIHWCERIHMVCWMNYEESELQPGNNRITRSKATAADLLVFGSLLPRKKQKQKTKKQKKTILLNPGAFRYC